MKRLTTLLAGGGIALSLAFGLAACSGEPPEKQTAEVRPAATTDQPLDGGTLTRRLASDIRTLNLVRHTTSSEKYVLGYLHDPLLAFDENLTLIPALAEKWEVAPDGKTYTFSMNPKATFSDGTPVRASDLIFTLKKIADPKSESIQLAGAFEGLDPVKTRAIDDRTAVIVFRERRTSQILSFNIGVLPEHVYDKGDFKNDFNEMVVGTGPYLLTKREAGKEIVLERRKDYWRQKPHIERVVFKIIAEDAVAWNALKTGDLDESRVTADSMHLEGNNPLVREKLAFYRSYILGWNFIPWNMHNPILSDKRVRRALAMAMDRQSIIQNIYHGGARIISGPYLPDHWAYNPNVKPIEYDLEAAKKLLAQAGWTDSNRDGLLDRDGKPLKIRMLVIAGNSASAGQGQIFQDALKKLGVGLELEKLDGATFFGRVTASNFEAAYLGVNLDADPDLYSMFHSSQIPPNGQNFVHYSNPAADRLIEQARVELDQKKRAELLQALHAILADDQPYTWTVQSAITTAINRRVRNVKESKGFGLYYWDPGPLGWWIDDTR